VSAARIWKSSTRECQQKCQQKQLRHPPRQVRFGDTLCLRIGKGLSGEGNRRTKDSFNCNQPPQEIRWADNRGVAELPQRQQVLFAAAHDVIRFRRQRAFQNHFVAGIGRCAGSAISWENQRGRFRQRASEPAISFKPQSSSEGNGGKVMAWVAGSGNSLVWPDASK